MSRFTRERERREKALRVRLYSDRPQKVTPSRSWRRREWRGGRCWSVKSSKSSMSKLEMQRFLREGSRCKIPGPRSIKGWSAFFLVLMKMSFSRIPCPGECRNSVVNRDQPLW